MGVEVPDADGNANQTLSLTLYPGLARGDAFPLLSQKKGGD